MIAFINCRAIASDEVCFYGDCLTSAVICSLPILPLPAPHVDEDLGPLPITQAIEESNDQSVEGQNKDNDQSNSAPTSIATHTRTIRIIYPPPDIRSIVNKTSQFVAKNGPEFEKMIIANNEGNTKFNFLRSFDPYNGSLKRERTAPTLSRKSTKGVLRAVADRCGAKRNKCGLEVRLIFMA